MSELRNLLRTRAIEHLAVFLELQMLSGATATELGNELDGIVQSAFRQLRGGYPKLSNKAKPDHDLRLIVIDYRTNEFVSGYPEIVEIAIEQLAGPMLQKRFFEGKRAMAQTLSHIGEHGVEYAGLNKTLGGVLEELEAEEKAEIEDAEKASQG